MSIFRLERNPTHRQLRQFGTIGAVLLLLFAWWQRETPAAAVALGTLGMVVLTCTVWCPTLLRHPFVWLSAILFPVGAVVGEVVLAAAYFLVVTPIAMMFRLLRRDPLNRTLDAGCATYWQEPKREASPPSYYRQY